MDIQNDLAKAKELIDTAQHILVVTHERPTPDSIGSALSLYLGLIHLGKKVTLVCPDAITVGLSNFIGVNKFAKELGQKNFVISLEYVEGSIEKVSYNIEGNRFNLVIEPRPGYDAFHQDKVHFLESTIDADCIMVVDTIHLGGLKKLYEDHKELFSNKPVINIDHHANNARFGTVNILDITASTTAELTAFLLSGLNVQLSPDIATNLLNAIYISTNNFQLPNISPSAFEVAAMAMKAGARRFISMPSNEERPTLETIKNDPEQAPFSVGGMPIQKSIGKSVNEVSQQQQAPSDWLKPKIFKSSS